jgi:hypothetical protein
MMNILVAVPVGPNWQTCMDRETMEPEPQTRLWQHDSLWRVQSLRQLTTRNGVQDAWESWRKNGRVLFFVSEEQAKAYLESNEKKSVGNSNG